MNEELKIIIKAVTDGAKKGINDVKNELEGISKSAKGVSGKVGAVMKGIGKGAVAAVAAIAAVTTALVALGKSTLQYNKEQAKLITAFQAAGASAEQAGETYKNLYRYLGDSGKAVEAANHLAMMTTNQQDLAEWTKITQGIYATFGDSLPIEGLTEAANETIRVGKVTGTLADALNWAGVSEDAFNARLATTNSLSEREAMLRETLNGLYDEAAEIYEKNNKALLDYNESQARLDTAMGQAGAAVMPLMTALNNLGTAFFTALKPALDAIIPPIAAFIEWIAKAVQSVLGFFSALTGKGATIKAVASGIGNAAGSAGDLSSGFNGVGDAASGAAQAVEEAKKSTQGFDELNIVSSGKSSGGSSGGSGGSGSGTSSGSGSTGTFKTEVEEAGGLANSLADEIRNTFSKIGEALSPSIEAWGSAFDTVKEAWNNAKPDFISGATDIKDGLATLGNYILNDFAPSVINSFSVNIAPVIGDTLGFAIEQTGETFRLFGGLFKDVTAEIIIPALDSLKTVSTGVFDAIGDAWSNKGSGFLSELGEGFDHVRGVLRTFYDETFKPIFDTLKSTFDNVWNTSLQPFVSNFVSSILDIGTNLLTLYNEIIAPIINWIQDNILPALTSLVQTAIGIIGGLVEPITTTINGVIDVFRGIISFITGVFTGDWELAWNGVKTIFSGIWDVISGILTTLTGVLNGLATLIKETVAKAFTTAWELIKGAWGLATSFFQGIWDGIKAVFEFVSTWFKGVFENAWSSIKTAWKDVKNWFSGVWDGIKLVFASIGTWFKEKFGGAWTSIKEAWKGVAEWFSGVWYNITVVFSNIGTWFFGVFDNAWKSIQLAWDTVVSWFSSIWYQISIPFSTIGTWFYGVFENAWNSIKLAWNSVISWFGQVWQGIANVFMPVSEWFGNAFRFAWDAIKNVFSNWGSFFSGLWDTIKSTFSTLGTSIANAIGGAVKSGINGVITMIENTINGAINLINGAIKLINKIPGVNVGSVSKLYLPRLARGGIVDTATIAMIGEQGKEAVVPLENNTEWMDKLADRLSARNSAPSKIVLMVDGKELGWANIHSINNITKQTGALQLQLV